MKSEELRVGNLVWLVSKSKEYIIDSGYDIDEGIDSEDFLPIPILETTLIRLGFKKWTDKKGIDITYSKSILILHKRRDGWVVKRSMPVVATVHQLQNLYFALTGEELTAE